QDRAQRRLHLCGHPLHKRGGVMRGWDFNNIAPRITGALVLAIILCVAFSNSVAPGGHYLVPPFYAPPRAARTHKEIFLTFAFVNNRRFNPRSVAGEIATLAEVMMRVPAAERPRLAAEISKDTLRLDIRDAPIAPPDTSLTRDLTSLRRIIEAQLQPLPQ